MSNLADTLSFHISGMHCASCAVNIQRRLNKTPGVSQATVNYANEQASVTLDRTVGSEAAISQAVKKLGYQAHIGGHDHGAGLSDQERQQELRRLTRYLIAGGVLAAALLFGAMAPFAPALLKNMWLMWLLATPVQFWAGARFYQSAWSALKARTSNMDTLIALGTSVAYFYSVGVVLFGEQLRQAGIEPHVYFETSATIIVLVLLGKYLEIRAKGQTSTAIKKLLHLQPKIAHVWVDGEWRDQSIDQVTVGGRLLVKPGEQVPVDGVIITGASALNESMVTGESLPVDKKAGQQVIGATLNTTGAFEMTAEKVGSATTLARIVRLVQEAQGSRPQIQKLVDTVSSYFIPTVIGLSLLTFAVWLLFGPDPKFPNALVSLISVLIIACPCALGLATPTSLIVGIGKGAGLGILIKNAEALETMNGVRTVVLDKTGTLTTGQLGVTDVLGRDYILQYAASVEAKSEHPVGQAIVDEAKRRGVPLLPVTDFQAYPGQGVGGVIEGPPRHRVVVGSPALLNNLGFHTEGCRQNREQLAKEGKTAIQVGVEDECAGVIAVADTIKASSRPAVEALGRLGVESYLLTGDNEITAAAIAGQAGIDANKTLANVMPDQKSATVKNLQRNGQRVAMVGDGINDAPALAAADVGIAMGGGTDVAIESATVTLLHSDISLVPKAIALSRATMRNIRQNLGWAFGYNIVLIPVAMGVLYPLFGLRLNPIIASLAMALSSVSVVLNAIRLKTVRL